MKYLIIIISLVALITFGSILSLLPKSKLPENKIALTINGHDIAKTVIERNHKRFGYHSNNKSDIYDAVITRELLIQEAQKQAIDKEDGFRRSLKDYYETSLITTLLERKNRELVVNVSQAEVDNFISYIGKTVTFTRLDTIPETQATASLAKGTSNTALFDDLAHPVKMLLSSLSPGQFGVKFDTGSEQYAIRLDKVQDLHTTIRHEPDRAKLIADLTTFKREQQINQWLAELKKNATIIIHGKK